MPLIADNSHFNALWVALQVADGCRSLVSSLAQTLLCIVKGLPFTTLGASL